MPPAPHTHSNAKQTKIYQSLDGELPSTPKKGKRSSFTSSMSLFTTEKRLFCNKDAI